MKCFWYFIVDLFISNIFLGIFNKFTCITAFIVLKNAASLKKFRGKDEYLVILLILFLFFKLPARIVFCEFRKFIIPYESCHACCFFVAFNLSSGYLITANIMRSYGQLFQLVCKLNNSTIRWTRFSEFLKWSKIQTKYIFFFLHYTVLFFFCVY